MCLPTSRSRGTGLAAERRIERITESRWTSITLTPGEQESLQSAGRQLATGRGRFGELDKDEESSLIHVHRVDATSARVRVLDAVGMVATPTLQLEVAPKIPS